MIAEIETLDPTNNNGQSDGNMEMNCRMSGTR